MSCAVPLDGIALLDAVNVIVEPDGARRGTLSQVTLRRDAARIRKTPVTRPHRRTPEAADPKRVIIVNPLTILIS